MSRSISETGERKKEEVTREKEKEKEKEKEREAEEKTRTKTEVVKDPDKVVREYTDFVRKNNIEGASEEMEKLVRVFENGA